MDFLPVFLKLKDRPCLVVGGGEVAARKVSLLVQARAQVTVLAPDLNSSLTALAKAGTVSYRNGTFSEADIAGFILVIAATDDEDVNRRVSVSAQALGIPVNVVDNPSLCSFITPSIIDRSPMMVAISTGGASPVLARQLRARLESLIPAGYGRLAKIVDEFRGKAKTLLKDTQARRIFWEKILAGSIPEMVFAGQEDRAREAIDKALQRESGSAPQLGDVYLVGAGPGDPDLLTFRALRLMQQADVVVYDRLVSPPILELVRRDAERIYAGKERANHAIPQEEINDLLVRLAKEGKCVVRLKGGDPFIFGRGGEEIETLTENGIPFQVVPGITAAAGCAAYSGIPLTHRDYAQSCVFVTGHLKDGTMNLNWTLLSQPNQTVVFYMGLQGVEILCRELIAHGVSPTMPAALVEQGTTPQQRVHIGNLTTLPDLVHQAKVHAPTLIIVGEVVSLHEKLEWFKPGERDGSLLPKP
jgi:uroporphyrin-III C-methyltransferase / precorrin-2 dehydrogenase / sirohydrochlorin ferrochelatase